MDALEYRNEGLDRPRAGLTIVGGGATGVELAGTLAELRNIGVSGGVPGDRPLDVQGRLIEMGPALLAPYHDLPALH